MTCREITSQLGEYVAGALEEFECARIEAHLEDCDACCAELAEIRWLETALRTIAPPVSAPPSGHSRTTFGVGRLAAAVVLGMVMLALSTQCFAPRMGTSPARSVGSGRVDETVDSDFNPSVAAAELYRVRARLNTLEGANAVLANRVVELEQQEQDDDDAAPDDDVDGTERWQLLSLPSMNRHRSRTHSSAMPRIKIGNGSIIAGSGTEHSPELTRPPGGK